MVNYNNIDITPLIEELEDYAKKYITQDYYSSTVVNTGISLNKKVDNLKNAIMHLSNKGIEFIDKTPCIGAENNLIAFIHPKSTGGILFELCQYPH